MKSVYLFLIQRHVSVCNKLYSELVIQFPITAIREIKILKKLHHENVVELKEIVTSPGNVFILTHTSHAEISLVYRESLTFMTVSVSVKGRDTDDQGKPGL